MNSHNFGRYLLRVHTPDVICQLRTDAELLRTCFEHACKAAELKTSTLSLSELKIFWKADSLQTAIFLTPAGRKLDSCEEITAYLVSSCQLDN